MAPEECGVKLLQSCCSLKTEAAICTSAVLWKHFPLVTFPCDCSVSSCCQVPLLPSSPPSCPPAGILTGKCSHAFTRNAASCLWLRVLQPELSKAFRCPCSQYDSPWTAVSKLAKRLWCFRRYISTHHPLSEPSHYRDTPGDDVIPGSACVNMVPCCTLLPLNQKPTVQLVSIKRRQGCKSLSAIAAIQCNGLGEKQDFILSAKLGISKTDCE